MNKEIQLLIKVCRTNKLEFSPDELAALLNLKFREGVYPYLRRLEEQNFLAKEGKGAYKLNEHNEKVKIIKFLLNLFGNNADILFSVHTQRILERFSSDPLLKVSQLPQHNLKKIRDIARKTRIIHTTREGNSDIYFIRSWEEPVKKLLDFFDIKLKFDEDAFKNYIIKSYSAFTGKQAHLVDEKQQELAKLNMQYYLEGKDFILNKLKNIESTETAILDILTKEKLKRFTNPFEITKKINEWKIKYVYNTDKIEGNALTFEEVTAGLTKGWEGIKKEKKDILETENSKKAIENIFDTAHELTLDFIKLLHSITQQGIDENAGSYKTEENCIIDSNGTLVDNTTPVQFVDERLKDLIKWYSENEKKLHPFVLASIFHNQFVYIHPFSDGNGRVSRLLLNFILIKHAFFPVIIYNDEKHKYYNTLRHSKEGDLKPSIMFLSDIYRTQLELF